MNGLRRMTTSIWGYFDRCVTHIENHEAIVNVALLDIQRAGARARAQLKRVQQDGVRLKSKFEELQRSEILWADRAVRCAQEDHSKALECVRRRKECQEELKRISENIATHQRLETDLQSDLQIIERKLEELKRRRNLLRTEETTARTRNTIAELEGTPLDDLEDIFTRWEIRIGEHNSNDLGPRASVEVLESQFLREEEEGELEAELSHLLNAPASFSK